MSVVSIERDIALDLLNTKLSQIRHEISLILERWNQESAIEFVNDARKGEIEEAEHDAIIMTNLLSAKEKFEKLLIEIE